MSKFTFIKNVGTPAETAKTGSTLTNLFAVELPTDARRKENAGNSAYTKLTPEQKARNKQLRKAWTSSQIYADKVKRTNDNTVCCVIVRQLGDNENHRLYLSKSDNGPIMAELDDNLSNAVLFFSPDEIDVFVNGEVGQNLLDEECMIMTAVKSTDKHGVSNVYVIKEKAETDEQTEDNDE